jgi:hypothetical protein
MVSGGEKKLQRKKSGKFCEALARFPLLFPFPHGHTFAIEYHYIEKFYKKKFTCHKRRKTP